MKKLKQLTFFDGHFTFTAMLYKLEGEELQYQFTLEYTDDEALPPKRYNVTNLEPIVEEIVRPAFESQNENMPRGFVEHVRCNEAVALSLMNRAGEHLTSADFGLIVRVAIEGEGVRLSLP